MIHKGDVLFIDPGTIHAIGAGSLIAEIQQLRMENEYLKKLQALVRTEERSPLKPK